MNILSRHSEVYWTWFYSLDESQQSLIYRADNEEDAIMYAARLLTEYCSPYLRKDSFTPFIADVDQINGDFLRENIYEITTKNGIKYAVGYSTKVEAEAAYLENNSLADYEGISDLTAVLQWLMDERTDAATLVHVKGNLCRKAGKFAPCDGGAGKAAREKERQEKKNRPKQVTDRTTIAELRVIANKHGIEHPANGKRRQPWIEAIKAHPEGGQYFGGKAKPKTEPAKKIAPEYDFSEEAPKLTPLAERAEKTKRTDHEQIQSLGLFLTNQHINKAALDQKEKDLFEAKVKAGEELTKAVQSGAGQGTINKLQDKFFKTEQQHFKAIDQREKEEAAQFQNLRDAIITHHSMDKAAIKAETDEFFYDPKIREKKGILDDVKHEINDFYALTGGKGLLTLGAIAKDTDRAYASPLGDGVVNIGEHNGNPLTLSANIKHEIGHHVEFGDSELKDAANNWRNSKATSKTPQSLRKLTGIKEYDEDEIALPGKYIDPYVGKVYTGDAVGQSTEVISMGIERFTTSRTMKKFHEADPDHFNFIVGVLLMKSKEPKRNRLNLEDLEI